MTSATPATRWTTPPALARQLGVAVDKVLAWIRSGELRAINVAARTSNRPRWRIPPEAIESFLAARVAGPVLSQPRSRRKQQRPAGWVDYF